MKHIAKQLLALLLSVVLFITIMPSMMVEARIINPKTLNYPAGWSSYYNDYNTLYIHVDSSVVDPSKVYGFRITFKGVKNEKDYNGSIHLSTNNKMWVADVTYGTDVKTNKEIKYELKKDSKKGTYSVTYKKAKALTTAKDQWFEFDISQWWPATEKNNVPLENIEFLGKDGKVISQLNQAGFANSRVTIAKGASLKNELLNVSGTITWKSANPKVATIANGTVKGLAVGTTKITATVGKKTYTYTVKVYDPNKSETATNAVNNIKVGWNLGNTLDTYGRSLWGDKKKADLTVYEYETAWGNPVTSQKLINAVKAQGFNAIRIPITWEEHVDSKGTVDKKWMARVKEVVDYAMNADMYCIINIHHDAGESNAQEKRGWIKADASNYAKNKTKITGLVKSIATTFKNYPSTLMFESYNEMLNANNDWDTIAPSDEDMATLNELNQLFVTTVRNTGGANKNRNLIINTYGCKITGKAASNFILPTDSTKDHLIIGVHSYEPKNLATVDMDAINEIFISKGVPCILGEIGCEKNVSVSERTNYYKAIITEAKKRNIKCFVWDDGGNYELFNRVSMKPINAKVMDSITKN